MKTIISTILYALFIQTVIGQSYEPKWESTPMNHEWSGGISGWYLPDEIIEKYRVPDPEFIDNHIQFQLRELVSTYQPALIFSDGEWDKPAEYWKSREFLAERERRSHLWDTCLGCFQPENRRV